MDNFLWLSNILSDINHKKNEININFFKGKNNVEVIILNGKNILHRLSVFLLISILMLNIISCSLQKKPLPKESQQEDGDKEVPKELEEFKKALDKIEGTLEQIHEEKKKTQQTIISEDAKNKKSSQQQGQSSQSEEQLQIQMKPEELSEYDKQQKKIQEQDEKLRKEKDNQEKFDKLKKDVTELHSLWNSFEPKAVASLASQKTIADFKNALNDFTDTIQIPDEYLNLLAINELYKYLPDFFELYKAEEPPDLDRLRYGIKKIKLVSEKEDFNTAKITLEYLTEVWSKSKPKFKKDAMSSINKFDFALNDLKTSIESKNKSKVRSSFKNN